MKISTSVAERMRYMLTRDKVGLTDGFAAAMKGDITHVLRDYFDLDGEVQISLRQEGDGKYSVNVTASANRIRHFATTLDTKRV